MLTKTKAAIVTTLFLSLGAQADTILNVATAGDQNMVDYVKTWLGPKFEAAHPGVKVRVIGTGPGDAGSNKISEKLTAQQESGAQQWDIDVAVVHQKAGGEQVARDCCKNTVRIFRPAAWLVRRAPPRRWALTLTDT